MDNKLRTALVIILVTLLSVTTVPTVFSDDGTFDPAGSPTVATENATGVGGYNATLQGNLTNDGGESCTLGFDYGLDTSYGNNVTALPTYIYVGGATNLTVWQVWQSNMTKKANTTSYGGQINALAEDDTYVYAGGATNLMVKQYYKSNMTLKANTSSYGGVIYTITQDDTYVYAGGVATPSNRSNVTQYWKSNMTKKANTTTPYGGDIRAIAQDSEYIYVAGSTTIKVIQYWKSNMTKKAETPSLLPGAVVYALAVDDNYIYAGGETNSVSQFWKSNMTWKANASIGYGDIVRVIVIDDTYVYVSGATQMTVKQYWASNMTYKAQTPSYGWTTSSIAVDSTYLYVGETTANSVRQYYKYNLALKANTTSYGGTIQAISSLTDKYATGNAFSFNSTGLTPLTTYHYRAYAINSAGKSVGDDKTFTTTVGAPTVTTNNATGIATTNTTLQGAIAYDGGEPCTVRFEYGLNTTYGTNSTNQTASTSGVFSFDATGLTPLTIYHYRAYANNSVGDSIGADKQFATFGTAPTVTTETATGVGGYNATLQGTISNDGGEGCNIGFEYGLNTTYGQNVTPLPIYIYAGGATTQKIYQYWQSNITKNAESANYTGIVYALAEDDTYIYAGGATNLTVWQIWKSNMTKKANSTSYGGIIYAIAQDANYIYIGGATNQTVWQIWKSNMTRKSNTMSYGGDIRALTQDSNYIYVAGATTQKVSQYYKSDMSLKANSTAYANTIYALTQDANYIYAGGATNQTVWQIWKSNMTLNAYSANYSGIIYAIAQDSEYMYVAGATTNAVRKYWKSNMTYTNLASPTYGATIYAIVQDSTYIYAGGITTNSVRQYYKSDMTLKASTISYGGTIWALSSFLTYVTGGAFSLNLTGLTQLTNYHYRAYANNSIGVATGLDIEFNTTVGAPTVTTNDATGVASTNATLQGLLSNDGGGLCTVRFEYGLNTTYGMNSTDQENKATGDTFSFDATGLLPLSTYHYRTYANNSVGGSVGADKQFATFGTAPTVETNDATGIALANVTLQGNLTADGGEACNVGFEYGVTTSYGTNATLPPTYIYAGGATTQKIYQYWQSNLTKNAESANYTGIVYALAEDDTYIYAGGATNQTVWQIWKSNMTLKAYSANYSGIIYAIAQDANYIYIGGATNQTVWQIWKSNMTKKANTTSYGGIVYALAQDANYIYFAGATTQKVSQYYKSDMTLKANSTAYGGTIYALGQDADYIYMGGATNQTVWQIWKSNMTLKTNTTSYGGQINAIIVNDDYIYVAGTANTVRKYWKSNMTYTNLVTASYGGAIQALTQDSIYIYAGGATNLTIKQYLKSNMTLNAYTSSYGGAIQSISSIGSYLAGPFSLNLMGIQSGTIYHYRAYANNSAGVAIGSDKTFTTLGPSVTTNNATGVRAINATLQGTLTNDGGEPCTVRFEYGLNTTYGLNSTDQNNKVTGETFSFDATELLTGMLYHYRAYANNSAGGTVGPDRTFFTMRPDAVYVDDNADPSWYNFDHVRTINESAINVTDGGTIYVWSGTYTERIIIANKNVTIIGNSTDLPIINPMLSNTTAQNIFLFSGSGYSLTLQYLNISNYFGGDTTPVHLGISVPAQNSLTVDHCIFHDINQAMKCYGNTTLTNNTVYHFKYRFFEGSWSAATYALQLICKYNVIWDSIDTDINNEIIHAKYGHWYGDISYNYIAGCRLGMWIEATGPACKFGGSWTIAHNTIDSRYGYEHPGNISQGISFASITGNFDKIDIRDNIINGANYYSIVHGGYAPGEPFNSSTIVTNCIFNNSYWMYFPYAPGFEQNRFQWNGTGYSENINYTVGDAIPVAGWVNSTVSGYMFDFQNCSVTDPMFNYDGAPGAEWWGLRYGSPAVGTASDGTNIGAWQGTPESISVWGASPRNNSLKVPLNQAQLSCNLNSSLPVNWTIETSPNIGSGSENEVINKTISINILGLQTWAEYSWFVNVTDGTTIVNKTYYFTGETFIVYVDDDAATEWYDAIHVRTIPEAVATVSANGTIYIYNGTYLNTGATTTENIIINKPVTITGESTDSVIINAQGKNNNLWFTGKNGTTIIENVTVMNWTRRGISQYNEQDPIIIRNNTVIGPDVATGNGNCIMFSGNDSIVEYNTVYATTLNSSTTDGTGIMLMSSSYSTIRNNYIRNKVKADNGIAVVAYYYNATPPYDWNLYAINNTIENNTIENASWNGILIGGWVFNTTVQNNVITNCTNGISVNWYLDNTKLIVKTPEDIIVNSNNVSAVHNNGISLDNVTRVTVENNIISSSNWSGIWMPLSNDGLITGNTITGNTRYGIEINAGSNLIYNNILNNTNNAYDNSSGNTWNITKTLETNIIGRPYLGGNYWSDYAGFDKDDYLGDTPYNANGNIINSYDYLPLLYDFSNYPPVLSNENPVNGTTNISIYLSAWNVTVEDPDGDLINVSIECSSGDSTMTNDATNGSFNVWFDALNFTTEYTIWVNVTDGKNFIHDWYTFTTTDNQPPTPPSNETIINGTTYATVYDQWLNVTASDPNGGDLTIYYYWGNGTAIGFTTMQSGDTAHLYLPDYTTPPWLDHDVTYNWYVNVSDGLSNVTGPLWNFHTSQAWDINEDRFIDTYDVSLLVANYGASLIAGSQGWDINNDGVVDTYDVSTLVSHYGMTY